jgi:hypothetical protein
MMTKPNAINKYVSEINAQLASISVARPWLTVSKSLLEAQRNLTPTEFRSLIKTLKFSKSRVSKLLTIASNQRLETFRDKLERVDAYTTLYEITTLEDADFQNFHAEFLSSASAKYIERSDVTKMKSKSKSTMPSSALLTFVTIKLDPTTVAVSFAKKLIEAVTLLQSTAPRGAIVTTSAYKTFVASRPSRPAASTTPPNSSNCKAPQPMLGNSVVAVAA